MLEVIHRTEKESENYISCAVNLRNVPTSRACHLPEPLQVPSPMVGRGQVLWPGHVDKKSLEKEMMEYSTICSLWKGEERRETMEALV